MSGIAGVATLYASLMSGVPAAIDCINTTGTATMNPNCGKDWSAQGNRGKTGALNVVMITTC